MDIEELAKQMRETAIKLETPLSQAEIDERIRKQNELELMQKLYFNAGRYAAGARDRTARQAFEQVTLHG